MKTVGKLSNTHTIKHREPNGIRLHANRYVRGIFNCIPFLYQRYRVCVSRSKWEGMGEQLRKT